MLTGTTLAVALLFRASFGFVSSPAYLSPQLWNAWTEKSNINFAEAAPAGVDSSSGIIEDKIKPELDSSLPASTMATKDLRMDASVSKTFIEGADPNAKVGSTSFNTKPEARAIHKASDERTQRFSGDEAALEIDERLETSGQALRGNTTGDEKATTAGGAKEVRGVDAAESRKLESLDLTDKPAPELADGTIKIWKKSKAEVAATPETTAAEKVLTLLELGLVDRDEIVAYYDALSGLERTTREAKEATVAAAFKPSLSSDKVTSTVTPRLQDGAVELIFFPAVCAVLGATGIRSLHLTGDLFTVASTVGVIAGGAVGWVVIARDDVVGGAAKAAGLAVARSAGAIGSRAGRSIKETAADATSAVASAAVEVIVNAPAKAAEELAKTVSNSASSAVGSVARLPGEIANNAADEAKSALQGTSQAAIGLPGDLAQQAAEAAGGALLDTSKAAMKAVKESRKGTTKQLLQDIIMAPGKSATFLVNGEWQKRGSPSKEAVVSTDSGGRAAAPSSVEVGGEAEMISLEALDAKMSSVREALERFDAVKNRIETVQTSESLSEMVSMTRRAEATPELEAGEATPIAESAENEKDANTPRVSRASASSSDRPKAKRFDEGTRRKVAEQLLERASKRAAEAKEDLRAAAASTRREVETINEAVPNVGVDAGQLAAGVAVDAKSR